MKKSLILSAILALTLAVGTANAVVTELVLNGGLENWTGGVPDSWDMQNRSAGDISTNPITAGDVNGGTPDYTISEETMDLHAGTTGSKALKCARNTSDYTYRYFASTNQIEPVVGNASYTGWQKGPNCRAYRALSQDGGATWGVDNVAALGGVTGPTNWTKVTATITSMQDPTYKYKLTFHSFSGESLLDDISLIGDDGTAPPLSIGAMDPPTVYYLTRTVTLKATPQGGNGTYTQVQFDIGNNGTIDGTDTTAPFEYSWDTQATQAAKGVVAVRVIATDSTLATGETIFNYTVDNRFAGRQNIITNGGFDAWQTENVNLPVDWVELQPIANATYGKEELDCPPDGLSTPSLQTTFAAFDATNRYTLRHVGKENSGGLYEDHQVTFWGKGTNCALQYFKSVDGGATWENVGVAASCGAPSWLYCIGEAQAVAANMFEISTVTTSNLQNKAIYDNIEWKAIFLPFTPPASVTGSWDIYE